MSSSMRRLRRARWTTTTSEPSTSCRRLLTIKSGLAARILASPDVGVESTQAALAKRFVGRGPAPPPAGPLLLTPRSKTALDLAVREVKADRSLHAGTEHLLLALARVTDGLAAKVLREVGLDELAIRKRREAQEQEGHRRGGE
jgi:ATP-dependent Clp protease ATP-binding subunit ClpA